MYKALNGGSTTGKSGRLYRFSTGDRIPVSRGELSHCKSVIWVQAEEREPSVEMVEPKKSTDYTVSELRDMDLSDKDDSFFEGDDRKTVQKLRE